MTLEDRILKLESRMTELEACVAREKVEHEALIARVVALLKEAKLRLVALYDL